jgi:hypothetical protein
MLKPIVLATLSAVLAAVPALAQTPKAEVGVTVGWVFSDGVSGDGVIVPGQGTFNRLDPKDSFGWGFDIGVFAGPNSEVGFLFGSQRSTLQAGGLTTKDIGSMSVNTYHGTYTYNFGDGNAGVRPYAMIGLGMTSFGEVPFTRANGVAGTIPGASRFSTTWGAGVKFYGASHVGGRVGARWTPTYIKSDASGYWCDPYWGCYVTGDPQYSNQFELNGGITLRF